MLLAVLAALAAAGPAPFTLDQVMSAPFPTEPRGRPRPSPGGLGHERQGLAQRLGGRGTRLRGPGRDHLHGGRRRGDHGPRLHRRCPGRGLRPRGRTEPRGRDPEPAEPDGGPRACRPRGDPGRRGSRRLAEGHSPLPHPRENRIVFIDKNQAFALDLAEGAKPERLFGARGGLGSLRFSADGALLAFVSNRGDHAFVGVYDLAAKSIRWMDPGVDRDGEPAFSPDGKSLAFLRLPARRTSSCFGAEREGEPWSIRVAEVASGRSREVFRADKGPGSVFAGVTRPQPGPLGSGRPPRVPLGEDRLAAPLFGARRGRRRPSPSPPASSRSSTSRPGPSEPRSSTARTPTTSIGATSGRCPWPEALPRPSPPAPASSGRR